MSESREHPTTPSVVSAPVPPLGGEGDKQADRNYRRGVRETVASGNVPAKAREAAESQDDPAERTEGERAEAAGKARSEGEDPQLERDRTRAARQRDARGS